MLKKMWDNVVGGPQAEPGQLRKLDTKDGKREGSMLTSPKSSQASPKTPMSGRKGDGDNVWRSVFNPGSNSATKSIGAEMFDKPLPNSPTVYDWLYSDDSRSKHR
ncbi:hypothetical protein QN277_020259 [Acacia crassicarpa]|uniref:Auxin-repressed protein n=1 Tax=Acacia crassicarpa TaxID=499986 RepID=A0AAE1MP54_9FABA|nr:hypothetical protein QN277_020259 [Acacia crassicarpa]